jgi:hypothetical protein
MPYFEADELLFRTAIFPPGLPGPCIPTTSNPSNYLYFLSPVIIDAILTSLCFYKAFQIARAGKASSILKIFVRDGSAVLYCRVSDQPRSDWLLDTAKKRNEGYKCPCCYLCI